MWKRLFRLFWQERYAIISASEKNKRRQSRHLFLRRENEQTVCGADIECEARVCEWETEMCSNYCIDSGKLKIEVKRVDYIEESAKNK